jgi:tetratricopeptide (TPR) repeat protein
MSTKVGFLRAAKLLGAMALLLAIGTALVAPSGEPEKAAVVKDAKSASLYEAPKVNVVAGELAPDDRALRYYASLNQTERVNSEIARLQRLYPGFAPPKDLFETAQSGGVDEDGLWELFAAERLDDLHAAIAAKEREEPGWKPSPDLARKLRSKETRKSITAFFRNGQWQDLVDFVKNKDLADFSEDPEVIWGIAEAHARVKRTADAVSLFKQVLRSSKERQTRIATIQKALGCLRMSDVEVLLAAVPLASDGTSEFASIMTDVTGARIAAFLHEERLQEVPQAELADFERYAKESRAPNKLGLVAWYQYKRRDFASALEWFKAAIENDGDAMIAHGLGHTLRALGRMREAEEVAFAWRGSSPNNVILFLDLLETDLSRPIPPYIETERLARYAGVTMEVASGEGAQALAWYAYNSCQFDVALFWFEHALAWFPKDATAYGYLLTSRRLGKNKNVYEIANRYDGLFTKVIQAIFPDGVRHPPSPCDQADAARLHGPPLRVSAYIVPGPAMIPGAPLNYDPSSYCSFAGRDNLAGADIEPPTYALRERTLRALKGKFPVAVAPQNPLRFKPLENVLLNQRSPSAFNVPLRSDPARRFAPLVARRVPGVGPMPYERFGYSLLSGWNGIQTPTWPPYSQQVAPAGTQWATQETDPTRAVARRGLVTSSSSQLLWGATRVGPQSPSTPQDVAAHCGTYTPPPLHTSR